MFGRKKKPSASAEAVLAILDACADAFVFPMMDNGYFYPAAARLSVHSDGVDWAIVIETFGYSPRAGVPGLVITTMTSRVPHPETRDDYVSDVAYEGYLRQHPHDDVAFRWPLDKGDWIDEEESVVPATTVLLRRRELPVPAAEDCRGVGITLGHDERVDVFELCRFFAETRRDDVLATEDERTHQVLPGLRQILVLEEWHHPDLVEGERPSSTETFRQLADVAVTGDASRYRTNEPSNTHWSNWPDGGTL